MKKKVLHIITGLGGGGAEGVLVRLCQQSSKDVQHVVVSLGDEGRYGKMMSDSGITIYFIRMRPSFFSLWKFIKLIKILRGERPDVVQTWMYHADFFGGIAARLVGIKRIFWGVRRSSLEKGKDSATTRMIAMLCAWLSGIVPEKIVCCAYRARVTHQAMGYCSDKLMVIQNGYDFSRFYPDGCARERARSELGVREDEFLIGMIARYAPSKDHQNLFEALALLKNKTDFLCVLAGSGLQENSELRDAVYRLGLENNVRFLDFRKDIQSMMNALDIHVLSSASEGFPNVVAEAMACGVPAISTDVGDAAHIIGDPSLCCPPKNPAALAELIMTQKNKWANKIEWNKVKEISRRRIVENFSLQSMVAQYKSAWFSVV